ncbi:MAG: indolepyruvate oxidoreductase subunit beta [Selenomonadaceae bacterium]|nr:indolepyruvate oxidoreductase subunit beta [Selenomonadaceae bacterium]
MNKNILLCGVGGQGIVLASKLIAQAAMENSLPVMSAETIGMAQKGGSVFSHVRIGSNLSTPMIPKGGADVIIGFEPAEAVRMLPYLKKDGTVIVNSCPTKPVTAMLSASSYTGKEMLDYLKKNVERLTIVDCERAASEIGSLKVVNMILLGAAAATGELPISMADIKTCLAKRLKPQLLEMNYKALEYTLNVKG